MWCDIPPCVKIVGGNSMVLFEIREFYKLGNESKFILVIYRKAVFCFRQNLFSM